MTLENRPLAFVAMKFDGDHWQDKRYTSIREELENAGFQCIRADELKTSGAVVDEVCRLLRDADLVVVDDTGDSQSVAYELGYCHGIGRPADKTLLIRGNSEIPFNYRHYRHLIYKDLRHLRRLIRDYLKIFEPLLDGQYGYAFTFEFQPGADFGYILHGAHQIFNALQQRRFSGRCECYAAERFQIPGRFFTVGIMLRRAGRKAIPEYAWWESLKESIERMTIKFNGKFLLEPNLSEMASKRDIVSALMPCGVAEFSEGQVHRLLGANTENFFEKWKKS